MTCSPPEALAAFSRGGLTPDERAVVEEHLDDCEACSRVVSELARIYSTQRPQDDSFEEPPLPADNDTLADESLPRRARAQMKAGERLDRYHILEVVGRGGMGVVYAAYDPDLDRKVALKVLRGDEGSDDENAQRRLLREAQAMAKLSHPNVITVHEVRVIGSRVFVSMEFVEGGTLSDWLDHKPDMTRVLTMFQDIGRGLAAAHAAGLVHRDVKPDNILIGLDDRPRVTDFGLARPTSPSDASAKLSRPPTTGPISVEQRLLDATMSQTRGLVGTPAYMAPEQLVGEPTTVASDQFSFCVVLYEALWGIRPFNGNTLAELANHVLDGVYSEPKHDPGVPRWVRQVILRGLCRRPEDRWPSMDALVERLKPGPRRARRRLLAIGTVATALVAAGLSANHLLSTPIDPCDGSERSMMELWSPDTRDQVERALARGSTPYAEDTAVLVLERLDEYATQWSTSHRNACEGYHRGEQSAEALDLRGACLDERRRELEALLGLLAKSEPEVRRHAIEAVDGLQAIELCDDVEALRARVPPPDDPTVRARVQQVGGKLARVRAHQHAGQYEAGMILANEATEAARATDYAPLVARALWERASLHDRLGQHEESVADLREAWPLALGAGDDALAAECVVDLVGVLGYFLRRYEAAALRIEDARAMIERVARHDPRHADELEASLLSARGGIEMRMHHFDEALRLYGQALELAERHAGAQSLRAASVLNAQAGARLAQQDWNEAIELYQRVLSLRIKHLGIAHPSAAQARNNLGLALKNKGELDAAAEELTQALEILVLSLGSDHPSVIMVETNLAEVYFNLGRYPEAVELYNRVFDPLPTEVGDENEVRKLQHYGASLNRSGQQERAREVLIVARDLARAFGAPMVVRTIIAELAREAIDSGEAERALGLLEQIVAYDDPISPSFFGELAMTRARALATLGQLDEARALLPTASERVGEPGWPTAEQLENLREQLDEPQP